MNVNTTTAKRCPKCGVFKSLTEFHKNSSRADGVQTRCKKCVNEIRRGTPTKPGQYRTATYESRRAYVTEAKRKPCFDCGGEFPPVVMDFDHRPGETKSFGIGALAGKKALELLAEEIAKCDVVCANCHRIRTATRAGWTN